MVSVTLGAEVEVDEIQKFFMNHGLCHTGAGFIKFHQFFQMLLVMGGGGGGGRRGLLHCLLFCKIVCHD